MKIKRKAIYSILAVLLVGTLVVSAGLLTYFGEIETTLDVQQSVILNGNNWDEPFQLTIDEAMGGCTYCEEHYVENLGCEGIWLDFEDYGLPNMEGIDVTYYVAIAEDCVLSLPQGFVVINADYPGDDSYFDTAIVSIPLGYDVTEDTYNGWCVDQGDNMVYGDTNATLWNSYDPANPWDDDDWDMVNYVINHKHVNATTKDIQEALWFFVNGGHDPNTIFGQHMVNEALLYGEGFFPVTGELIAVLVDCGDDVQRTFIEVVFPECPEPGECDEGSIFEMPFYLDSGERIDFSIVYHLDMLIEPMEYIIHHELIPGTVPS